ncbi:MAG: signal peptide peptidase SppA [Candidatus Calescibacterium sp.]|nr:signal peptide peptidase SppA [Candidatus Calescibacterium sp.]MCX7971624.1 signal peptide peptidase SppA [bacterium]MDW8195832.1 signal peptide peptidase SppA [Candidatus Calescibacterium sp.]
MKLIKTFFLLVFTVLISCSIILFLIFLARGNENGNLVAVLRLQGIIVNYEGEEGTIDTTQVLSALDNIEKNNKYKALLLIVDSPGGMAAPSLEVTYKIRSIKKKKPVVTYIQNLGASGAYYISSASSYIVSNPQAIVGSIGVIISVPQIYKAMDKIGIQVINIKSGKYKDSLSPFKPLQKDQIEYLQNLVMEYYYQFVRDVAENRNLKTTQQIKELYEIADGRVFSSYTAMKYGLVDEVGVLQNAKEKIKQILKDKDIKFVEIKLYRRSPLERLLGSNIVNKIQPTLRYGVWMIID